MERRPTTVRDLAVMCIPADHREERAKYLPDDLACTSQGLCRNDSYWQFGKFRRFSITLFRCSHLLDSGYEVKNPKG